MFRCLVTSVACGALLACGGLSGCSDPASNEGRILLDRLEQLDAEAPFPIREQTLSLLSGLALEDAELSEIRDVCLEGHQALLTAEQALRELNHTVEGLEERDTPITDAERAGLDEDWSRAQTGKETAEEQLPVCQEHIQALRMEVSRR